MKYFVLMVAVLALCSVSSCNKEKLSPSTSIVGKWRWVKSVGGIGGFTLTPKSEGISLREEFYADSTFKTFRNDSITMQGKFSIVRNYKYSSTETIDILKMGTPVNDSFIIRNDTLYTDNYRFVSDGFSATYVRIK